MKANFNVTGNDRKTLVKAIAKITGDKAVYKFLPTYAFEIGNITVSKTGVVSCEDDEKLTGILQALAKEGYEPLETETTAPEAEAPQAPQEETESAKEEAPQTEEAPAEADGLTIILPLDKVAVGTLDNLLKAKGTLIKKALGVEELVYQIEENRISFPWFKTMPEPDAVKAYTDFIAKLCKLSKELKRASATETPAENEKYAFRCFLLRLGFIGTDYKAERKILLKNLSGNSSWKNGDPKKAEEVAACE